jgi:hypothetical protein
VRKPLQYQRVRLLRLRQRLYMRLLDALCCCMLLHRAAHPHSQLGRFDKPCVIIIIVIVIVIVIIIVIIIIHGTVLVDRHECKCQMQGGRS